jgi:aldehyde dehydrogenase (NAD+)
MVSFVLATKQKEFSPVIVEEDADLLITAKRLIWGKFLGNGQTCLAPDYLITTDTVKNQLVGLFTQIIHEFYGTDIQLSNDYGRIVNTKHFE